MDIECVWQMINDPSDPDQKEHLKNFRYWLSRNEINDQRFITISQAGTLRPGQKSKSGAYNTRFKVQEKTETPKVSSKDVLDG